MGDRRQIAEAMYNLSFIRAMKEDLPAAEAMADQATQIFAELGDARAVARLHWAVGSLLQFQDRTAEAIPLLESALDRFRELDDLPYVSLTLGSLGWAHMRLGDLDAAMRYGVRSLVGFTPAAMSRRPRSRSMQARSCWACWGAGRMRPSPKGLSER